MVEAARCGPTDSSSHPVENLSPRSLSSNAFSFAPETLTILTWFSQCLRERERSGTGPACVPGGAEALGVGEGTGAAVLWPREPHRG